MPRKRRYETDPVKREAYLNYFKTIYQGQKEKRAEYRKLFYSEPQNRLHTLLVNAKSTAKRRCIPYDLAVSDIEIPTHCPLLEIPLTFTVGEGRLDSTMSLDRIIPGLGYVKNNVRIVSDLANRMKNSATPEQLKTFAKNILKDLM